MMNVMVSICVVTYQHAKYIRQALDSFWHKNVILTLKF